MKLELKGITKRYGSLVANDHIDLTVEQGQIHALLGENGAGKTTLVNVLYGLAQPDEGEILIDGQPQHLGSPSHAIKAGIGMVHQHFMLVPVFTVAENVTLGMERTRVLGLIDRRRTRRDVRELSERYGLQVNPDTLVEDLPVGVQQRVEIVKALLREANVLILDEPTSVLTPGESQELFRIMRELRSGGRSIVFISHKLKEVQEIADTITVIRRGRVVGQRPPTTSDAELASLMVGRSVQLRVTKPPASPGDVRLDVQGLTVAGEEDKSALDEVSFQVRAGEILGVAGVQGNGQTELCEALLGLVPAAAGSVRLEGQDLTHATPRQRLHSGVGYIPEDRQEDGLVAGFSVGENLILDVYNEPPYSSGIALDRGTINKTAAERVADFDIRTTSTATPVGTLSGGNQQKVILAREIGRDVRLLVASQPTRGLDVGSIEFVHRRIVEERDQGVAVLIISSELDEIYALSDRIAVMYEGKITGFRDPDVPPEELGMLMAGASDADAAAFGAAADHGQIAGGEAADETGLMEAGLYGVGLPGVAGNRREPADEGPAAGDGTHADGSDGSGSGSQSGGTQSGGSGSGPADDSGADPE
ncbi:MAG: transporter related protein [Actinomycetia bacterium]|nr:transporter related protein [Actinomycetes bacterium]